MDPKKSPLQIMEEAALAQPSLWPDPDELAMGDKFGVGEFTGERLAARDPERYRAICSALANGMGIRRIARAYRVSTNTVAVIRGVEGLSIETIKQGLAASCRHGAAMAVERIIEEMDLIKRESLPIVAGVLIDKAQLLEGQPTQIHGQADAPRDWDQARQAIRQARGRVIEDAPETGLGARNAATKGEDAHAGLPEPRPETGDCLATDSQSPVKPSPLNAPAHSGHVPGHDTTDQGTPGTDQGTPAQLVRPGGGGGSSAAAAPRTPIDSATENFDTKEPL